MRRGGRARNENFATEDCEVSWQRWLDLQIRIRRFGSGMLHSDAPVRSRKYSVIVPGEAYPLMPCFRLRMSVTQAPCVCNVDHGWLKRKRSSQAGCRKAAPRHRQSKFGLQKSNIIPAALPLFAVSWLLKRAGEFMEQRKMAPMQWIAKALFFQ